MAGKATGERIEQKRKAKIIAAAANGHSINKVAKYANVARSTAHVVMEQESATIEARKRKLTELYTEIALRGAERLRDGIDTAPYGSLVPITGMSTDKLLALTTNPENQLNQHLHVHLQPINLMDKFNEMISNLPSAKINSDMLSIESNSVAVNSVAVESPQEISREEQSKTE